MSIDVVGVTKRFGPFVAVEDVTLRVETGELVALLGPSGCGQDDAAARDRRPRDPGRGGASCSTAGPRRRPASRRPPRRLRLPALRAVPPHVGLREHRLRPAGPAARDAAAGGGDRAAGAPAARARAARGDGRSAAGATVRRAAAARGARARAGGRAEGPAARRAVRRARREGAQGAPPLAPPPARRTARHQHLRDARPGGGARGGRPRRRDEPGTRRAGRHADRRSTRTRPRRSSTTSSAT